MEIGNGNRNVLERPTRLISGLSRKRENVPLEIIRRQDTLSRPARLYFLWRPSRCVPLVTRWPMRLELMFCTQTSDAASTGCSMGCVTYALEHSESARVNYLEVLALEPGCMWVRPG